MRKERCNLKLAADHKDRFVRAGILLRHLRADSPAVDIKDDADYQTMNPLSTGHHLRGPGGSPAHDEILAELLDLLTAIPVEQRSSILAAAVKSAPRRGHGGKWTVWVSTALKERFHEAKAAVCPVGATHGLFVEFLLLLIERETASSSLQKQQTPQKPSFMRIPMMFSKSSFAQQPPRISNQRSTYRSVSTIPRNIGAIGASLKSLSSSLTPRSSRPLSGMRNMRIDSESPITEGFSLRLAQSSSQQINVDCEELPEYSAVVMRDDMEAIEEWSHEANSHGNSEECEGFDRESLLSHIVNSDPPEETVPGYSINDTFPDVNTNSSLIGMSQMEHQTLQHASMCGELENFEIPTSAEVKSSAPAYSIPVSPPMYLPPMFAEEPKSEPQDGPVLVFHSAEFSSFSAMAFALSDFKLQQEYLWSSRRAPSGTHSFVESSGTTDAITAIYESVDSEKREDEYPQFLFGHDFHDHHKLPHASSFDCAESNTSGCRFFEDWGSSRGAGENGCFREWETGSLETGIANCNWHVECPPYVGNVSDSRHVKQDRIHDTCGDLVEFEKYFYLDDESKSSRCGSKNGSILFGLGEEFDLCQGGTVVGGDDPPAYHNNTWAKGNNMDIV